MRDEGFTHGGVLSNNRNQKARAYDMLICRKHIANHSGEQAQPKPSCFPRHHMKYETAEPEPALAEAIVERDSEGHMGGFVLGKLCYDGFSNKVSRSLSSRVALKQCW